MDEAFDGGPICQQAHELSAPPARRVIVAALRDYLNSARLTATELVHLGAHSRALTDAGTELQGAVQKAAIAQVRVTKRPVAERVRQLFDLCTAATVQIEALQKALPPGPVTPAVLKALMNDTYADGLRRGLILLARHLAEAKNWTGKLDRCADILAAESDPVVETQVDAVVGEILSAESAIVELLHAPANGFARLTLLAALLDASWSDPEGGKDWTAVRKLAALLKARKMTATRHALKEQIGRTLTGTTPIASKTAYEEFEALATVADRLHVREGRADLSDLTQLMERRMAGTVRPETLAALTEGSQSVGQKILRTVVLHDRAVGAEARQTLATALGHLFNRGDLAAVFAGTGASPEERLKLIAEVHDRIVKSSLAEQRRKTFAQLVAGLRQQGAPAAGADAERRAALRLPAHPDDHVVLNGLRAPLRNWSVSGLLFGPMQSPPAIGQTLTIKVSVIHSGGERIRFDARADVLRIVDGQIAARYQCLTPEAAAQVKRYFEKR